MRVRGDRRQKERRRRGRRRILVDLVVVDRELSLHHSRKSIATLLGVSIETLERRIADRRAHLYRCPDCYDLVDLDARALTCRNAHPISAFLRGA